MVTDASLLLNHQVGQFEQAIVASSVLLRQEAERIGAERLAARKAALAEREASWAQNTSYYLNHIGSLECRLKVIDQHFYKEFQVSLAQWEAAGRPSLRGLMGLPPRVDLPQAPTLSEAAPQYPVPPFMMSTEHSGDDTPGPGQALPSALPPLRFISVDLDAESPEKDEDTPIDVDNIDEQ